MYFIDCNVDRFNKDLKMSQCVEREEERSDRPESPTSSCVSKGKPPDFTNEPGPSHTQYVNQIYDTPWSLVNTVIDVIIELCKSG